MKKAEEILRLYNALCVNAEIAKNRVDNVNRALAVLSPEEQIVIHMLFIEPTDDSVSDACEEIHKERAMVYRIRERALKKFSMAFFGEDC